MSRGHASEENPSLLRVHVLLNPSHETLHSHPIRIIRRQHHYIFLLILEWPFPTNKNHSEASHSVGWRDGDQEKPWTARLSLSFSGFPTPSSSFLSPVKQEEKHNTVYVEPIIQGTYRILFVFPLTHQRYVLNTTISTPFQCLPCLLIEPFLMMRSDTLWMTALSEFDSRRNGAQ